MLDIHIYICSMRQIYWANEDKGNWEFSCWKAEVLSSIPQSSSCWIRRARQRVELADEETIAKLLQCLRLSRFWGLWTYLGGWVPLALQRAQVIAPVELWSEQGDSGSIFLFKFGQTWSFAWNAPSWIFDTPDWRCFVVTFFGINKMLTDGISRGRSWKRRVQCFLFLEKSISSQFRLFANVECFLFLGKWISSQFRWFANVQPQQSKDLHKDAQKKKVPLTRWGGGGLGGGPAEYPSVHLKEVDPNLNSLQIFNFNNLTLRIVTKVPKKGPNHQVRWGWPSWVSCCPS